MNASKFTRGLDPFLGDACSAKSFEVSPLIFSTDCIPIDVLPFVLKISRLEDVFLFFFSSKNQASRSGEEELV
jgi:hypothetical protein